MSLKLLNRVAAVSSLIFILTFNICPAQEPSLFKGEVNTNNINVRSDATVSSEIICTLKKGDVVDIVLELYEWYKIRLPQNAPSYIKTDLVECISYENTGSPNSFIRDETKKCCLNAKALKKRINIRLHPNESSQILGWIDRDEIITVLKKSGEWYRIKPSNNSFGWIHKKFTDKVY